MKAYCSLLVVVLMAAVPCAAQELPPLSASPEVQEFALGLSVGQPDSPTEPDRGMRYQFSRSARGLTGIALSDGGDVVSRLSLSRTDGGLALDLVDSEEALSTEVLSKDCAGFSQRQVGALKDWVGVLLSSLESGLLEDEDGLIEDFKNQAFTRLAACESVNSQDDLRNVAGSFTSSTYSLITANNSATVLQPLRAAWSGSQDWYCTLRWVQLRDVDTQTENTYCEVVLDTSSSPWFWLLRAVGGTSDSDAICGARCVRVN